MIAIIGASGFVGKNLVKLYTEDEVVLTYFKNKIIRKNAIKLNCLNKNEVKQFFKEYSIKKVFFLSARSGGIGANVKYGAEFLYENLEMQNNIFFYAKEFNVEKLIFVASSCMYPKNSLQPIKEEYLLDGRIEETSKPYAISKIAGVTMCETFNKYYNTNFISVVPATLYGENGKFDSEDSHVLHAIINKIYNAKRENKNLILWGSGEVFREFLYIQDFVKMLKYIMDNIDYKDINSHINLGSKEEIKISDLANLIKDTIDFKKDIIFDKTKPDGVKRKKLDTTLMQKLGINFYTPLIEGIKQTCEWYERNMNV